MITIEQAPPKKKLLRTILELAIATVCAAGAALTIELIVLTVISGPTLGMRDFVVYWATGQQLAHHADPYGPAGLLQLERAAGLRNDMGVMFLRNPPTALPMVYPIGLLSLRVASCLWPLPLIAAFVISVFLLRRMNGAPKNLRIYLAFFFGPALICLMNGQCTVFALLGLVLFLQFHRSRPFIAGACFWLCALKPHLFLPFGVVLLVWAITSRRFRMLAGLGVASTLNFATMFYLDPNAWHQYTQMMRTSGIQSDYIPCASFLLRHWISPNQIWIQYVPAALACIWALRYYWARRSEWDWMRDGSLLMLVSILAAPYSWLYDQVLAVPALLYGAYQTRSRNMLALLALLSALTEVALFCNNLKPYAVYLWTGWSAPAWVIWYMAATASNDGLENGFMTKVRALLSRSLTTNHPALSTVTGSHEQPAKTPAYPLL